jgi:hypothetical protein
VALLMTIIIGYLQEGHFRPDTVAGYQASLTDKVWTASMNPVSQSNTPEEFLIISAIKQSTLCVKWSSSRRVKFMNYYSILRETCAKYQ